jgi:DNA polymerase I-like protein with 3'-5' exonuclease and polymerase domains
LTLPWYLNVSDRPWKVWAPDTVTAIPVLTIDLETTNKDKGDPRNPDNYIVRSAVKVLDGETTADPARFFDILEEREGKPTVVVCHNCKFEFAWLNREGFDTSQWLPFDTMIAEFVIAGNRGWDLSLDAVAQRYKLGSKGRLIDRLMKGGVCPSEMPAKELTERVIWDVDKTWALAQRQRDILFRDGLERVFFTRVIFTPVLAHMETYGMSLDPDRVREEYETAVKRRTELHGELIAIAKGRKLKGPQLAKLVYDDLGFPEVTDYRGQPILTDTGQRSTAADTLAQLVAKTPDQKRFLAAFREYNKVSDAISKYLAFFHGIVEERGGTFYANFNQTVVRSHRLSSSGKRVTFRDGKGRSAQFQNLPRAYKRLFRVLAGRKFSTVDGAQLEFRVGGSLGRDPQVRLDVECGADIHRFTAHYLLGIPEEKVSKAQRQDAKSQTFKPMYGGNSGTKKQKAYYAAFRAKYKAMFDTQTKWTHEVLATGQLRIASGLIFYWPGTKMDPKTGYISNTPSIFDYPIQSLATADIIPVAVVYTFWQSRALGLDVRLINTVHDSLEADVADGDLDKYHEVVIDSFLNKVYEYLEAVYGLSLYVPLGVAYRSGTHWGEGEETTVSYPHRGN